MADVPVSGQTIQVPNLLAAKVGGREGEGLVSELVKNAERKVHDLAQDYLAWVTGDLRKLDAIVEALAEAGSDQAGCVMQAYEILHNMKGNGATFGYDLVTAIADSGCGLLRKQTRIDSARRDALRHHVAALKVVLDKRITGAGGDPGKRLLARLEALAAPFR